ncbi:hypothetical protein RQP46_002123 [Phenoliferia psychrophenolica]
MSALESNGRILRQVTALVFEQATDNPTYADMYASLCRKIMEKLSMDVKDEGVKGPDGQVVAGPALFRKLLLNRCQEDYETGWQVMQLVDVAAGPMVSYDNLRSAARTARRRGLGLVRFMGELYRLQMLTERIMHECIKKYLVNVEDPREEDVESLCHLLLIVGKSLDTVAAKAHMDIYFDRMQTIANNMRVSPNLRSMVQEVLELRLGGWVPSNIVAGPKYPSESRTCASSSSAAVEELSKPELSVVSMSRVEGERRATNSAKEFFAVRSIAAGIASVEALPNEDRPFLMSSLANAAIKSSPDDVQLTCRLFVEVVAKSIVSHEEMLASFALPLKSLIDIKLEIPPAYTFVAQLLVGAGVSREELARKMEALEKDRQADVTRSQALLLAVVNKLDV